MGGGGPHYLEQRRFVNARSNALRPTLEPQAAEAESQDPLVRLEEENKQLQSTVMRLEAENEMLANEVGTCQMTAHDRVEQMDIKLSKASRENARLQALLGRVQSEAAEDKERLELEASQVKAMYRTVVEESDNVAAELRNETRRFEAERVA